MGEGWGWWWGLAEMSSADISVSYLAYNYLLTSLKLTYP